MGEWLYRYDAMNRLVEASNGAMTAKFYYDAKNRCVARSYQQTNLTPSTLNLTLNYYDNWNLIAEYDLREAQIARYVHGRRTDEIVLMVNRHGVFYPHHDVLGNVTMLTDSAGKLVERYSYSVEGKVTITDAAGKTSNNSAVGNRWMFTGREWLAEVGLYDYRNRVYSAELGRFLQTDPIRFSAGDVNIYRYVLNRYTRIGDALGLAPGDSFPTPDAAAMDASTNFRAVYGNAPFEMGTWIKGDGQGGYKYDDYTTQYQPHSVDIGPKPEAAVATWHNHPTSEDISAVDIQTNNRADVDGYVLAPSNEVKKYDEPDSWWDSLLLWLGFKDPIETIGDINTE